jgi:type II secretion system protein G
MTEEKRPSFPGARAFTLIELLIVVAIIAILAAIAVPNFLEAQTRAKVTRCMADMRAIGNAIETYFVDNGKPPQDEQPDAWRSSAEYLSVLSTPICYIASLPPDPFATLGIISGSGENASHGTYNYHGYGPEDATSNPDAWWCIERTIQKGFRWSLATVGPSRTYCSPTASWTNMIPWNILAVIPGDPQNTYLYLYDATNGTKSRGYVMYTNKGFLTGDMVAKY